MGIFVHLIFFFLIHGADLLQMLCSLVLWQNALICILGCLTSLVNCDILFGSLAYCYFGKFQVDAFFLICCTNPMPLRLPLYFDHGYMLINQFLQLFSCTFVDSSGKQWTVCLVCRFGSEIVHCTLYVAFHIINRYHIFIILACIVAKRVY